jgi:hypothetical protein
MRLLDAIAQVDRTTKNTQTWFDYEPFVEVLNLDCMDMHSGESRFTMHFLSEWMCTDTNVGAAAYFLDNQPVAYSWKPTRGRPPAIRFVSQEASEKVREFLLALWIERQERKDVPLIGSSEEISDHFSCDSSSKIIIDNGFIVEGDRMVPATLVRAKWPDRGAEHEVKVRVRDGAVKNIAVADFLMPIRVPREQVDPEDMSTKFSALGISPPFAGYKRQWIRCRTCGRAQYRDFIPFSLSNPIITTACGHGAGERDLGCDEISDAEAINILTETRQAEMR